MVELTLEQQKALALAKARRRRKEAEGVATAPSAGALPDGRETSTVFGTRSVVDGDRVRPVYKEDLLDIPMPPPASNVTEGLPFEPTPTDTWGDMANGLVAALGDGTRQGASMVLGAPVDLINNAPRLANLLPGVEGVGPLSENPVGGRAMVDSILRGGGLIEDYEPRNAKERIANRVGEEIGATAVPVGGAIAKASTMPVSVVNRMAANPASVGEGIAAQFLQPAAVNPVGLGAKEAYYAAAGGLGAGLANETFGGDNPLVDLGGSIAGTLVAGTGAGVAGGVRNLAAGITGSPKFADDVAQSAVSERIINSSADLQEQASRLASAGIDPSQLSTDRLVAALRMAAPVEEAIPGYRANIADRTQDPGLATLAFGADSNSPGFAAVRRTGNEAAVNERMGAMAPDGDPERFRTDLQTGVDAQIGTAQAGQEAAQGMFDNIVQALQPVMREAGARGSAIRSALADAYGAAQENVRGLYGKLDDKGTLVDPAPLVQSAKSVDMNLAPNDAKRFRPVEASTIEEMMPGDRAPLRDTGIVNEFNRPVFAETAAAPKGGDVPALPGEAIGRPGTTVPLSDVTAIRSGLTDDLRAAQRAGNSQQGRVLNQYIEAIDTYLDDALGDGMRAALDEARTARRDVGERFERPGTALDAILGKREGGGYAMDDSAVPAKIAQPDQGNLTDLRAALTEAGTDARLRDGLADEVRSDVTTRGLLDKPTALGRYMADRQVLLGEFPELRAQLEEAGVSKATLDAAEKTAAETTKRLTTPGRSAEASYLKNVEDPAAAIRSVIANPDPRKAVADLVATAGSPKAKADMRAALWEEVKRAGKMDAPGTGGETRWNGKKLKRMFEDPKFAAVAEELWADDPEDLANIKTVFEALAGAEGSSRARVPGSSGTAQALSGKLDPALTASSLASRARSVSRGQLSPVIAVVDVLGTWLRRRSAQVQSRAIDTLTAAVVNNPGLAADLLEKYNPATAAARRKMMTQKYGVRATSLLNIMEEAESEDPVLDAVEGK